MQKMVPVIISTSVNTKRTSDPLASTSGMDSNMVFKMLTNSAAWANVMKTRPTEVWHCNSRRAAFFMLNWL